MLLGRFCGGLEVCWGCFGVVGLVLVLGELYLRGRGGVKLWTLLVLLVLFSRRLEVSRCRVVVRLKMLELLSGTKGVLECR